MAAHFSTALSRRQHIAQHIAFSNRLLQPDCFCSTAVFESLCDQGAGAKQPTTAMASDTMTAIPAMIIPGSHHFGIFKDHDFMHWSKHSVGFKTKEPKDDGRQT